MAVANIKIQTMVTSMKKSWVAEKYAQTISM